MFDVFSAALLISAVIGPRVGRQIDLMGGRGVLVVLGLAGSVQPLSLAWIILGFWDGPGLYDNAFATLAASTAVTRAVPSPAPL